jgi:multidrug efflux system outer membrane protein
MRDDAARVFRPAWLAVLACAAALAGCAVGPDYKHPAPAVDAAYVGAGSTAVNAQPVSADIATFWRGFGDPVLTGLVEQSIAANGDIRIAKARLQEARASLSGARAASLPEVDIAGGAARSLAAASQLPGLTRSQRLDNAFDGAFMASWEIDFFGRQRRATEGASAQVEAGQAAVHAAQMVVVAEVVRNYLDLRGLQQRYQVAAQSLANQQQTLALTISRFKVGRGTQLDVVRARSLVGSTEAALPALQANIERSAFRVATLAAQPPRLVLQTLAVPQPLPELPTTDLAALPVGTPAQLLRRRPDLVLAERQLAASTAAIGVATADLFPRVSFTGLIGFATDRVSQLGSRDAQQNGFGAALSWPLLDFGRVRSRIGISEARASQALANYEQAVATALEETEGAMAQFTRSAQQAERLAGSARDAEEATRLSRIRFGAGAVDLLIVLDAERQALAARDALVQAQTAQATALVSVYRSLGGGWAVDAATQ